MKHLRTEEQPPGAGGRTFDRSYWNSGQKEGGCVWWTCRKGKSHLRESHELCGKYRKQLRNRRTGSHRSALLLSLPI